MYPLTLDFADPTDKARVSFGMNDTGFLVQWRSVKPYDPFDPFADDEPAVIEFYVGPVQLRALQRVLESAQAPVPFSCEIVCLNNGQGRDASLHCQCTDTSMAGPGPRPPFKFWLEGVGFSDGKELPLKRGDVSLLLDLVVTARNYDRVQPEPLRFGL